MEAGLTEIVRSVNRSWIYDGYFSLYRPIHPGGNVRGGIVRIPVHHAKRGARNFESCHKLSYCMIFVT